MISRVFSNIYKKTQQDNSDVGGAKRAKWLKSDKEYASGGFKKEQSVSIFGYGEGLDWTGTKTVGSPQNYRTVPKPKGYKPPNVNTLQKQTKTNDEPKKKLFGLF